MHRLRTDKTRVLLVYPRFRLPTGDPPLGLAYIASCLISSGIAEVRIADATFHPSLHYITSAITEFDPDIVGIYVDTLMSNDAMAVARTAKQREKFVVVGGPHATVMPESLIGEADIVVIGEGELAFLDIVERYPDRDFAAIPGIWYKSGDDMMKTAPRVMFADLDTLSFPAFDMLDMGPYLHRWHYLDCLDIGLKGTNLLGSRGCPFECTYCQPTLKSLFGNNIRYRSADNIVSELALLQNRYGISSFFFHDDTLTIDRNRLVALCEAILHAGLKIQWGCNTRVDTVDRYLVAFMYAAGLRKFHVGAESGSQRILDDIYNKRITLEQVRHAVAIAKEAGVHVLCFFVLGAPSETIQEIRKTATFARSLQIDEATFSILTPLPGSDIRNRIASDATYELCNDFSDYNYYSRRVFTDPHLSNSVLKLAQLMALVGFYGRHDRLTYILRHLSSIKGFKKLVRKVARSL